MRSFCFLLTLLSTTSLAVAQQAPAPVASSAPVTPVSAVAAGSYTRADSVEALHRYFSRKRTRGTILTVSLLAAPAGAVQVAKQETDPFNRAFTYALLVPAASALSVGSYIYHRQFTAKHEENAVRDLQNGQLSAHLKRKLKRRYFLPNEVSIL